MLFKFYYNSDALFGKQDRHHRVKETYWIPTAADVAALEVDLDAYTKPIPDATDLERLGNSHWPLTVPVRSYFRQYAGVMRGGEKIVLINGFAPSFMSGFVSLPSRTDKGGDWRSRAVIICDGGFSFFHAAYNLTNHKIEDLQFNGFA